MRPARPAALAALTAALLGSMPALGASPALGALETTCQGKPVTVQGAVGTEGDDVMRAPLDAWKGVEGLGGNDTICLVDGTDLVSRDPMFFADAGPGDDLVVYEATYSATVRLGAGADQFVGNDAGAYVYTGASAPIPGGVGYFGQTDTEVDVVMAGDGRDSVYSGDTGSVTDNPDRISTGASNVDTDSVFYAGRMTSEGALDNGSSRDLLFLVGAWAQGTLSIDNVAGRADLAGSEVLRWTGVRQFVVDERPEAVRFVGGPLAESITVGEPQLPTPGPVMSVDVSSGGGRDRVSLAGALQGSIDLGRGRDDLTLGGACERTRLRLDSHVTCTRGAERTRSELSGLEKVLVLGPDVTAIGTAGRDVITVNGHRARVRGRAGRDVLWTSRRDGVVDGGPGRDRCTGRVQRRCER